jgi:hypothetical protein
VSTATVTPIRPPEVTCLRALRLLPEDRRRELLEELASAIVVGPHPPPVPEVVEVQVIAWSSPSLSPTQAMERWGDVLGEADRLNAVEANEPEWRDVCPQMCRDDYEAAVGDLVNGTDRYRGDRAR